MSADNPNDFFRPPNDNAYEADELRTGPPLDYVAEKFRHCLECLHCTIHEIERCTLEFRTQIEFDEGEGFHFRGKMKAFDDCAWQHSLHEHLSERSRKLPS